MNSFTRKNDDAQLLENVIAVLHKVGGLMLSRFETTPHFTNLDEVITAIHANDTASLSILRDGLQNLRPNAGWVEDENDAGDLPNGEWWVIDPVEGNINHICLLYTSPSPRDRQKSRMPSSA